MDSTKDKTIENNYILREIKYIKEKSIPENIEILQDLAVIHEIKDIKSKSIPNLQQIIVSQPKSEVDIKLEGGLTNRTVEENIEETETVFENEQINNLIEYIFNILNSIEIIDNIDDLKKIFSELKEDGKIEVIEGVKIKIENEEQENKFNDLLKLLC